MPASDFDAPQAQQVAQHATAGVRLLQVQFVKASHQRQFGVGGRLGVAIYRPATDAQQLGLTLGRQSVIAVDHGFSLSNPALPNAPSKKVVLQRQLPDLDELATPLRDW